MPLCFLFGFRDVAEPWYTKDDVDGDAEVTGSADVEHLSRFAPFRRARFALKAQSAHSPRTSSSRSRNTHPSPAVHDYRPTQPTPQPMPTPSYAAENQQALPSLRPEYSNFMQSQTLPMNQMNQGFYQNTPDPVAQQMTGLMPDMVISQPSMDEYIQTADDMAGYLTWNAMEVPSWLNYGNLFPPAG